MERVEMEMLSVLAVAGAVFWFKFYFFGLRRAVLA